MYQTFVSCERNFPFFLSHINAATFGKTFAKVWYRATGPILSNITHDRQPMVKLEHDRQPTVPVAVIRKLCDGTGTGVCLQLAARHAVVSCNSSPDDQSGHAGTGRERHGSMAAAQLGRRAAVLCATAAVSYCRFDAAHAQPALNLASRLDAKELTPLAGSISSFPGDARYPPWLAGTWRINNTPAGFSMPLGVRAVDRVLVEEARAEAAAAKPVVYLQRFTGAPSTGWIRQDRQFNAIAEEGAFVEPRGFAVERGTYLCDEEHPHGRVLLDIVDRGGDGSKVSGSAAVTVSAATRSKLELETLWVAWEETPLLSPVDASNGAAPAFVTSELVVQRALFPTAVANRDEVLDTSYLEILWQFEPQSSAAQPNSVKARNRVAQLSVLERSNEAGGRARSRGSGDATTLLDRLGMGQAVSILDYDVIMERVG